MLQYIKYLIREFLIIDNDCELSSLLNQDQTLEQSLKIEKMQLENQELILEEKKKSYLTLKNLIYILGFLGLIGGTYLYFYNNALFNINFDISKIGHLSELDNTGIILYKLSAELSKSCTVKSWEVVHKVLKDLEKDSFNIIELVGELEKLKNNNLLFPGEFSTNYYSFNKSLIKLINFLKEIL